MTLPSLSIIAGVQLLLVGTVGVCVAVGILAWRERPEPGAVPLTALMAGVCWWTAALFFRLDETGLGNKVLWFDAGWLGIVVIPVAWVLFSLEYTGNSQYIRTRYIILLSIIPVISGVLGLTNFYHSLVYTDSMLVENNGAIILDRTPGPWFWVIAVYTLLLGLVGTLPLLDFVRSKVEHFRGQSLAILVGSLAPVCTNILFLFDIIPPNGIDPTPVSFSISGIAFLGALTRFRLFTTSPAPIQPAQEAVFQRMKEGIIVLDRNDNIIELNDEAQRVLDTRPEAALGRSIGTAVPETNSLMQNQSGSKTIESGHKTYDVSLNQITDTHGRLLGKVLTLHNITEHMRQQQRLEVLNRVFRHNIRTNTQVIMGNAEYLASENSESKAKKVQQKAEEIEQVSSEIRTVLDIFEQARKEPDLASLHTILEECVRSVGREYASVNIKYEARFDDCNVNSILSKVLYNLIENAAQYNTSSEPKVWIEVTVNSDRVQISIRDNGPGIEHEELALMENKTETPLEHGSGFGLAIAMWGTELADGQIAFEEREPTGLSVSVEVPILAETDSGEDASSGGVNWNSIATEQF